MSSDSIFTSIESEKRWVLTMENIFPQQHIPNNTPQQNILNINFDSLCIFKVPKTQTEEKPEAYAPHHLGLGPYHHLRPDLHKMNLKKLAAIRNYLTPQELQNFRLVVESLIPLEPTIRATYDQYLDLDIKTLAWILAIDAIYLLQFLKNYSQGDNLAGDIMMLENQIPVFLLKNILRLCHSEAAEIDESSFFEVLENFLRDQSPLEWIPGMIGIEYMIQDHLLQCLYNLIVFQSYTPQSRIAIEDVEKGIEFLAEQGLPGFSTAGRILSFVNKVPWSKIKGLIKKDGGEGGDKQTPKIDIPSASRMSKAAGIKFIPTQGIWSVRFEDSSKNLHLPILRMTATSEVVLRNLVAYEEASLRPESAHVVAEYLDLMCGIIDCGNDVKLLKEEKIIESELWDEEIARILNGISKSTRKSGGKCKSNVEKAVDGVNKRYKKLATVKVKAFFEKSVFGSLKVLGVLISVVVLVVLVLQAFCSVFGCGRWFSKSPSQNRSILFSYQ